MANLKHKDIVELVESIEIIQLTPDNFDFFYHRAEDFLTEGQKFQEYYSQGYNEATATIYDFSKKKPEYQTTGETLRFESIELKEIKEERKKWLNIKFDIDAAVWSIRPDRLPIKFGFKPDKALYIADQSLNGTPELPWETVYMKIE